MASYYSSQIGIWYFSWWGHDNPETALHWQREAGAVSSRFGEYSAGDPEVYKFQLDWMQKAGIDFIIFEITNGWEADSGVIKNNMDAIVSEIDRRGPGQAPQYAFALGGELRYGYIREHEMLVQDLYDKYGTRPMYYKWKGKPLLITFTDPDYFFWTSRLFNVRNSTGVVSQWAKDKSVQKKGLWGFTFDAQVPDSEVYGITPCHEANHLWIATPDTHKWDFDRGEHGSRYIRSWLDAIKKDRPVIIITSYNDFSEETAIEAFTPRRNNEGYITAPLIDYYGNEVPDWYEKITEAYIALKHGLSEGYQYRFENGSRIFIYKNGRCETIPEPLPRQPVILLPDDFVIQDDPF